MQELQAIFDVIGTPEWACLETVENERWRYFLRQLPAQAPHLIRNFSFAGEPAIDLLRRMLAFDPQRRCAHALWWGLHRLSLSKITTDQLLCRCSAAEAISHEYVGIPPAKVVDQAVSEATPPRDEAIVKSVSMPSTGSKRELRPASTWLRLLDGSVGAAASSAVAGEATCSESPRRESGGKRRKSDAHVAAHTARDASGGLVGAVLTFFTCAPVLVTNWNVRSFDVQGTEQPLMMFQGHLGQQG